MLHYLPFFEGFFVFHFQLLLLLLLPLPSFSETVFSELQEFDELTRDAIWVAMVVVVVIVVGVGTAADGLHELQAGGTPATLGHLGAFRAGNSGWVGRVQWSEEE